MRQANYRRKSSSTGKFYGFLDSSLPVKPTFTMIAASVLVIFIIFGMTCFAAAVFESSKAGLSEAGQTAEECTVYYAAETAAVDILSTLSDDDGNSLTDKNGELKYDYAGNEITISRNGGNFSFDVPVQQKETLHVLAQITGGDIKIIQWYINP